MPHCVVSQASQIHHFWGRDLAKPKGGQFTLHAQGAARRSVRWALAAAGDNFSLPIRWFKRLSRALPLTMLGLSIAQ